MRDFVNENSQAGMCEIAEAILLGRRFEEDEN
jgi:hypothetical protein